MKTIHALFSRLAIPVLMAISACSHKPLSTHHAALKELNQRKTSNLLGGLPGELKGVRGGAAHAQEQAVAQRQPEVLKKSQQPWIGSRNRPVKAEEKLPAIFYESLILAQADGDQGVNIDQLADRLADITRLSVRVLPEVHDALAVIPRLQANESMEFMDDPDMVDFEAIDGEKPAKSGDRQKAAPVETRQNQRGRSGQPSVAAPLTLPPHLLKWRGSLRGFLNHLSDRLNLYWTFEDNTIVLSRFATEVFELAALPSESRYKFDSDAKGGSARRGSGGGGGGSSASGSGAGSQGAGSVSGSLALEIREEGVLNYHKDAVAVVRKLVSSVPGSEVLLATGSGRLVVKTSRPVLHQIRTFLQAENASLLKQVLIQMDVYTLASNSNNQFGVNWGLVYDRLLSLGTLGINSPQSLTDETVGRATFLMSDKGRLANSTAVIQSLSQIGYSAQHRPVSMLAMNRQWVRKSRLSTQSYLAETTPAVSTTNNTSAVSLPGLTPGSVTVGDQIAIMPYVLDNNTVVLKFGLSFSDLLRLDIVGSGEGVSRQQVQVPSTALLSDQFTVALRPGEVFAITGLSRDTSSVDKATLGEALSVWAGGSQRSSSNREHFLVFLRVVIL